MIESVAVFLDYRVNCKHCIARLLLMPINVSFRFVSYARLPDGKTHVKLENDSPDFPLGQWQLATEHVCNTEVEVVIVNLEGGDWRLLDRRLLR